jgi:hypothetical protein
MAGLSATALATTLAAALAASRGARGVVVERGGGWAGH